MRRGTTPIGFHSGRVPTVAMMLAEGLLLVAGLAVMAAMVIVAGALMA